MISVPITLEQLITAIKQLQPDERAQIAQVLVQEKLQADLTGLIQELYSQPPVDEVSDEDILTEVKAVRQQPPSA
uniref:Uncharacterized protein n=1 Tax=Lyngbya confervoides BDU141951 TaxID=1574623 RepID=A0A0C1VFY3_9CYAN